MTTMKNRLTHFFSPAIEKIVLSKPASKSNEFRKIVITQKKENYQIEKFTQTQVFHQNVAWEEVLSFCSETLSSSFLQCNAWDNEFEYIILISKQGKISQKKKAIQSISAPVVEKTHNRKKQYFLEEGTPIPPLVDMGIFTKEGKIVRSMYDKFKQINRFVEMIDDSLKNQQVEHLNIIDFGCGKSYLTFILYYYFTEIKKISVKMVGLDLKEDVIQKCNETAQRYHYENLEFHLGDIAGYQTDFPVDMVITLHACDTATDYALYNAIQWGAKTIFSVPCCQHELNAQMETDNLSLLTRYGIIKERTAALMTDAIRGNLLELSGYKSQILEFVDLSHTPKNLLIRGVKRETSLPESQKQELLREVKALMEEFHLQPTLYQLLFSKE